MKSRRIPFTAIFIYVYHQHAKHFVTTFIKNYHISGKMTIWPRNSTEHFGWVNTHKPRAEPREIFSAPLNMNHCTILLWRPTKLLKPWHVSLFDILPSDFLADSDIWLSGLEHRNKFKHVISRFKSMCNPVLFAIPHKLWIPYHNFGAFRWYNK